MRILLKLAEDIVKKFYDYYLRLFDKIFHHGENGFIDIFTL